MRTYRVLGALTVMALLICAGTASAQNFNSDARTVAMGGSGTDNTNIAMSMVPKGQPYKVIVLPFGLIQVLRDIDKFNPTNSKFDPVVMIEDLSNPIHYTFNRHDNTSGASGSATLINDLRNGNISRNLGTYQGFKMPTTLSAQGLVAPALGGTIKIIKKKNGGFQGLFLGAGPYIGIADTLNVDQSLVNIFATGVVPSTAAPSVHNVSQFQLAMDYVIGWRGRVPLKANADKNDRDGVYFAYNYRVIRGFRLLQDDMTTRFDIVGGQIDLAPATVPFTVTDVQAKKGTGKASDIGFEVVKGLFSFGFGLNGMGNKIDWTNFQTKTITLNSLSNIAQTNQTTTTTTVANTTNALTIKLPVVKTGNVSFEKFGWGAMMSYTQGYNGKSFRGGVERKVGPMWVRGGGKYTRGKWDPTYGFGFGTKKAIDVGFFGTHGNLANERKLAMAVSLRFMPGDKKPTVKK